MCNAQAASGRPFCDADFALSSRPEYSAKSTSASPAAGDARVAVALFIRYVFALFKRLVPAHFSYGASKKWQKPQLKVTNRKCWTRQKIVDIFRKWSGQKSFRYDQSHIGLSTFTT
jgi:hypothetical protein